jgi:hypothetical protein
VTPQRSAGAFGRLAALLLTGALSTPIVASAALPPPPAEEDLLLLTVRLDQTVLAEALATFALPDGGVLVPLGELCRLLELGIVVDAGRGRAAGFVLAEERRFALDLGAGTVTIAGQPRRLDLARVAVDAVDLYVDAGLLAEWLPLRLEIDRYGALIIVRPSEKLPLQLRLEREKKLRLHQVHRVSYPKLELPYSLADGPFVDQTLRFGHRDGENTVEASTFATGDLLYMEAHAFVAGTTEELKDARLTLTRKDPDGRLLGPLGAREVAVGDVFHPGLDLIVLPRSGNGLLLSNYPLHAAAQFDRQTFRGDLPPGWAVELYRGEELLAYAQARADGLFEFLETPLLFGLNVFRFEYYGPQGQRRTETRLLNIGDALTPRGKVYYRLAGNDPSLRLAGDAAGASGPRSSFDLSAGFTQTLSGSFSLATVELADGQHHYGKAGLRKTWGSLFANLDVAADQRGGLAWQGTVQTRVAGIGVHAQHAELDGFLSERFLARRDVPVRSRSLLRLDAVVPATFLPRIPVLLELRQDRLTSGERVSELAFRLSAYRHGTAVSNQLRVILDETVEDDRRETATGKFLLSKYLRHGAFRGEADYELTPKAELVSLALTGERRVGRDILISATVNRAWRSGHTRFLAGLGKQEGLFAYSVQAEYSAQGGFGANILLSVGLGRDGRTGDWHAQARALASSGGVSGRAFLDANGNGRFDGGEETLPGVGLLVNGAAHPARTDEAGDVFLANIPPHHLVDVAIATGTLEDPFWKPATAGVSILPRPGKVAVLDFPVLITGEVTGTVHLARPGRERREIGGVEIQLVDAGGRVVATVRSAYDGFYDMADVRPGRYQVRVAPGQPQLDGYAAAARQVDIRPNGTVVDGLDFTLAPA